MTTVLLVLLAAFWRVFEGSDKNVLLARRLPTPLDDPVQRWRVYVDFHVPHGAWQGVGIAIALVASEGHGWFALLMAGWAMASLSVGLTDWYFWTWQAFRFSIPSAALGWVLVFFGQTTPEMASCYFLLSVLGGLSYPMLLHLHDQGWWKRWWPGDGPEWWARAVLGATVLGGLVFL